jgi:hypothetical protein
VLWLIHLCAAGVWFALAYALHEVVEAPDVLADLCWVIAFIILLEAHK